MSCIEREIVRMSMKDMTDVDRMFGRHAQVNMDKIPSAYQSLVWETKKKCVDRIIPVGVIRSVDIGGIEGDIVILEENGGRWQIESALLAELLKDSRATMWFSVTLRGFEELLADSVDLLGQFFLDAWGSAFASRAGMHTADYARSMLEERGLFYTSAWEPGQHGLDIHSQQAAFSILEPEEIGLTLTKSMLMVPSKSVSGVFGISETEDLRELIACDYCSLRDSCPSSYNAGAKGGVFCGGMASQGGNG